MPAEPCETSDEQGQAFWRAAEAARDVHDRYQFFVWLRLHLNRFLPHDLALCLFREDGPSAQAVRVELFYSVPIANTLLDELAKGRSRWWRELDECWARGGRQAAVVPLPEDSASQETAALHAAGFRALLVHGFDAQAGMRPETVFVFALGGTDADGDRCLRTATHMNLCLPVLHCTAVRALAPGRVDGRALPDPRELLREPRGKDGTVVALTQRQIEIIAAVRDAKRNAEIGRMLGISAATVKNHLHTIMRKLHAANRAQAVAEAMARRLIS
jgi:DNA-binding CsgD family transcriptional regulator